MDLPLKVHSHMRSGTHLLMATLAANFEFDDLSIEAEVPGQRWYATGEARAVVPWGRLFGDHEPLAQARTPPERILYIVRDPRDTLHSLWHFEGAGTALEEFLTPERIVYWYRHASEYCAHVHWIRFEDLTGDGFDGVMASIARRFGLRLRAPASEGFRRVEPLRRLVAGAGRAGTLAQLAARTASALRVGHPPGVPRLRASRTAVPMTMP